MNDAFCDRCGRPIQQSDAAYLVWLWVVARVNDEIPPSVPRDWNEMVAQTAERFSAVPAEQIAAEVYARRSYLVCSTCKEQIVKNPFGRRDEQNAEEN
jgi:hypothetical protein